MLDSEPRASASEDSYYACKTFNFEEFSQAVLPTLEAEIALKISNELDGNSNVFLNDVQTQTDHSFSQSPNALFWLEITGRNAISGLVDELAEFQRELQEAVLDGSMDIAWMTTGKVLQCLFVSTGVQTSDHLNDDGEYSDCSRLSRPRSTGGVICSV